MWTWLKNLMPGGRLEIAPPHQSIAYQAVATGLDRRRHARIQLPPESSSYFPEIAFQGERMKVVDLSIGGACLADPKGAMGEAVGNEIEVELAWAKASEIVTCQVVAHSRHTNRHLKFQNLSVESLTRISLLVRAGSGGRRMRKVPSLRTSPATLVAAELWTGVNGDCLAFATDGEILAELCLHASTYHFTRTAQVYVVSKTGERPRLASHAECADALICLVNIPYPSPFVKSLIDALSPGGVGIVRSGA